MVWGVFWVGLSTKEGPCLGPQNSTVPFSRGPLKDLIQRATHLLTYVREVDIGTILQMTPTLSDA